MWFFKVYIKSYRTRHSVIKQKIVWSHWNKFRHAPASYGLKIQKAILSKVLDTVCIHNQKIIICKHRQRNQKKLIKCALNQKIYRRRERRKVALWRHSRINKIVRTFATEHANTKSFFFWTAFLCRNLWSVGKVTKQFSATLFSFLDLKLFVKYF